MKKMRFFLLTIFILVHAQIFAQTQPLPYEVTMTKDAERGWLMTIDGVPTPVYGMVWSFTPIGEKYTYNLWSQPEEHIKKVIDIDFSMMKKIGVNVIRSFTTIPPKWVSYIYEKYGIYTAINYLFGRYGISVNNKWHPQTDYSMPATRKKLIDETIKTIEKYKNVAGVIMFMLGNENNYGLEWQSNEVQNLPEKERHRAKAEYLYSVFGEAVEEARKRTNLPLTIVNGDILYIELIKKHVSNIDFLATNVYRGKRTYEPENEYSTPFFEVIAEVLDKPVLFSEFGSDAYNAITKVEDQYHQAEYLRSQWQELFEYSAGKSATNSAIGGFVFQWMDEWWKKGLDTRLDIHDTEGTWVNGGYAFDFIPELWNKHNNMNEEWLGILAQSAEYYTSYYGKINKRIPRAAYYMLGEIWEENMLLMNDEESAEHFASVDVTRHLARALEHKNEDSKPQKISIAPTLKGAMRGHWSDEDETLDFSFEQLAFLNIGMRPTENFGAKLDFRLQYEALDDVFFDSYSYMLAYGEHKDALTEKYRIAAELYSSAFLFETEYLDIEGLYHDGYRNPGHTDWVTEGDFFGLLPETFYKPELDRELSKAPFGIELTTRSYLEGFKLYLGPELFRNSRPSAMAKFYREFQTTTGAYRVGILHEEELAKKIKVEDQSDDALARKSSLMLGYSTGRLGEIFSMDMDLGILYSGAEKVDTEYVTGYTLIEGVPIRKKEAIKISDALAYKAKLELHFNTNPVFSLWTQYVYAGLAANSREIKNRNGSSIVDNGSGNKNELIGGLSLYYGDFHLLASYLWRSPLLAPYSKKVAGTGINRDPINEYVTVNGNRESLQFELLLTYDMTGATYFYEWNNDDKEDALFAGSVGLHYTVYNGETDALKYKMADDSYASWSMGLNRVKNLYAAKIRLVSALSPAQKLIFTGLYGTSQNTGNPDTEVQLSYSAKLSYFLQQFEFSSWLEKNIWGPEDWHREFGFTIPWQIGAYFAFHFDTLSSLEPTHYVFTMFRFRNYEGIEDDALGALNPLGSLSDSQRFELTLGYNLKF